MDKYALEAFIETLQTNLDKSEDMWSKGISHAEIVGYLQGTIKGTISVLKDKRNLLNKE
jgi:hypothetical protein